MSAHFQTQQDIPAYSIKRHFGPDCTVLLTGATGYIGSLVLEKLCRSTNVSHIFVLLRPHRGRTPGERLRQLLHSPLFHMLLKPSGEAHSAGSTAGSGSCSSDSSTLQEYEEASPSDTGASDASSRSRLDPRVVLKVSAIAGDISKPGLGLSDGDRALLLSRVDTVIHCAAGGGWAGAITSQGAPRRLEGREAFCERVFLSECGC